MKTSLDVLFLRRPVLNYVSPPVCDVLFSSSSGPVIVLDALGHLTGVSGIILDGTGRFRLSWNSYPGALCYSIYEAVDPAHPETSEYVLVAECIQDTFYDPGHSGCFRISAITPDGETPLSAPICGTVPELPTAITDAADNIGTNSARLHGRSNPKGAATMVFFEWGLTTSYGNVTTTQDIGSGTVEIAAQEDILGLTDGTVYHFRIVAHNANGTAHGDDMEFMTENGGGTGISIEVVDLNPVNSLTN